MANKVQKGEKEYTRVRKWKQPNRILNKNNHNQTAPSGEVDVDKKETMMVEVVRGGAQPMKFMVTRWRIMCEKMKSAKPRSGEMPRKCTLFWGFACSLRLTPNTKQPTVQMKPERKELKGKVPTRQQ